MDHYLLRMLVQETVTTWDFVDRLLLTAWSLDPASGTASYHGRVRITTSRGTLQIHECLIWQTPPFPVPLPVLLGAFWTAPVGPQPGAHGVTGVGGSVSGEVSSGGSGTPTTPVAVLEETLEMAAAAAGEGSIGGPEVPHLVSPSLSLEDSSCVQILPPSPTLTTSSTTPTMCVILISSDSDMDSGPEEYEVTSRARARSESSCLVCGEHPCCCPP
ncbi:hypothetical protein P8452_18573 [Trifolium repens]|nr:hypothetical protein P8452_18573 [Trifolium repens]